MPIVKFPRPERVAQNADGADPFMSRVEASDHPVITIGIEGYTTRFEVDFHSHGKAQLMLCLSGVLTCEAEGGIWLVPPQSAICIPGQVRHRLTLSGKIEGYVAFFHATAAHALPATCCTVGISPLLRELIVRSAHLPGEYPIASPHEEHLVSLLLLEAERAPVGNLHLPMPRHPGLRSVFEAMLAAPARQGTVQTWARHANLSERTLARLIAAETGMSFGRWRQQLNILLALQWLADGATVQKVALDLGYESPGSFITMFRKALGCSPARYMARQR